MGAIGNEVVAPDMGAVGWSKPDAGSVVQPQTAALRLSMWYFQPFATPDPLHPLGIHRPSLLSKQGSDATIAIATIVRGQSDNIRRQALLIRSWQQTPALGRTVLANHPACTALGDTEHRTRMGNASTAS